ncbi:MAG: SPOR domain-containing protein [Maribacter dokdonensis]|uniref:Sporulation related domain-containing protein n=1 Tax=Maribacter dokdonensis TaxID=320912 RepID=A0A1H4MTB8_9FLAO|nr:MULTISPECIES: SPOR domain-containing protein [Maribacter]HAI37660.1 SPOR domain-containing protein [Maribacter sp.]APA64806.1 translation initiation factor IF-2 [Maribacter sp. 1_2014MBL_MicDiv]KSA15074.1 Translation initiation factor IF-2 [Maribacter dokdonensis DSW-8]MBU2900190.1 SPOR domain-containing protein [Maribacter dokdonensis]MDP2525627.1 SPOR domain-containing protein [Maribacter dokdonensis]|tara:strand:+ start:68 stop:439 length:372 start_codon:yes stop_codon:yes gene_type:complete
MKTLSTLVIFACITQFTYAQGAKVTIQQDQKIDQLLEVYKTSLSNNEYYRIQVGFGNYAKAKEIKANVEEDFPELVSKIDFDSPTYRVRVGRFTSKLDAERKFNEVRVKYPNAMLLKPKKSTK